jgi:hypothetical protein
MPSNDVWFWLFWFTFVPGVIWSISRELHIRQASKASRGIVNQQIKLGRAFKQLCDKLDTADGRSQNLFADVKQLVLDVERRISILLQIIGGDKSTHIHNRMDWIDNDSKTDIHGGQNNVGDNKIGGDQKQK